MNTNTHTRAGLALLVAAALPFATAATSQEAALQIYMSDMAAELEIEEAIVQACMPAPLQEEATTHPELAEITECINSAGTSFTQSEVNAAWYAHRQ